MTDTDLETRTVRTCIETSDSDSHSPDAPIATFEYGADQFTVPATVDLVIWLDRAVVRGESMHETLDLVLDAWIERYCVQLCGGQDSAAAKHLYHNVQNIKHIRRTFRAAAINHVNSATVNVRDEFDPTVDAFFTEVSDKYDNIGIGPEPVISDRKNVADAEIDEFRRRIQKLREKTSDDEDDPESQ